MEGGRSESCGSRMQRQAERAGGSKAELTLRFLKFCISISVVFPYSMDDGNPQKFFMSGFTGYVPRARFLFGSSFPVLTNQALREFGHKDSQGGAQKDPKHLPPLPRIYPQKLGLLPNYGGYVPGYKFQFGHTFGHLTHDTLGLSTFQKQLLA
nr:protein FAM166B isoform X3 [Microcebus murinus]